MSMTGQNQVPLSYLGPFHIPHTISLDAMVLGSIGDTKYTGEEKIVIAMDIGTTHSEHPLMSNFISYKLTYLGAVSFAYLYPEDYVLIRVVRKQRPCLLLKVEIAIFR
jgi:hypothetical protein